MFIRVGLSDRHDEESSLNYAVCEVYLCVCLCWIMAASRLLVYDNTLQKPHTERCNAIRLKRNTDHERASYESLYLTKTEISNMRQEDLEDVARLWFHVY